jgi:hypothetical protein
LHPPFTDEGSRHDGDSRRDNLLFHLPAHSLGRLPVDVVSLIRASTMRWRFHRANSSPDVRTKSVMSVVSKESGDHTFVEEASSINSRALFRSRGEGSVMDVIECKYPGNEPPGRG